MKRRNFIKTISAATIAGVSIPVSADEKLLISPDTLIKPPALRKGNKIGLITPGSYITEKEKEDSISSLNNLGFEVEPSKYLMKRNKYFSGTDEERAADLNEMFNRKDVSGIVCARGGYGCTRILPFIDYEMIKKNPKPLIGYSDVSAIHSALLTRIGLVSFHGPVGISTYNDFTINYFKKILMNPSEQLILQSEPDADDENPYGVITINGGTSRGKLIGGNLSIIVSQLGTADELDFNNKIIFFEEIGEEPYRIDRMFTQLIQSGKFNSAAGIALGVFKNCEAVSGRSSFDISYSLVEVLNDRLGSLNIPVVYGLSFGHIKNKFTLPLGIEAELNADKKIITLKESAVL